MFYLSFFRAVPKNTGLIPDLQDADPVCIRLQNLGKPSMTVDYRSFFDSAAGSA